MPGQFAEAKVEHQEPTELVAGSAQGGVSFNIRIQFPDESDGTPYSFPTRAERTGNRFGVSLSFLSVKSAIGIYPDTGESGDAYDAETAS